MDMPHARAHLKQEAVHDHGNRVAVYEVADTQHHERVECDWSWGIASQIMHLKCGRVFFGELLTLKGAVAGKGYPVG